LRFFRTQGCPFSSDLLFGAGSLVEVENTKSGLNGWHVPVIQPLSVGWFGLGSIINVGVRLNEPGPKVKK